MYSYPGPYSLVNRRQVTPCNPSPCGTMASCHVSRNRAVCHCLPGMIFIYIFVYNYKDFIHEIPNANFNDDPLELTGYNGIPPACTPKCFKDFDCPDNLACLHGVCGDPCHTKCSRNEYTFCAVIDHTPTCVDATNANLLLRTAPGYKKKN